MTHGLVLGATDLVSGVLAPGGYRISVYADGVTFGTPEAVVREIVSMLADGNHVRYDRAGNRVVSFDVEIEADNGTALQAGEVALRRELYRPSTVQWTPPAPSSAPTVFEVITSSMSPQFDDIDELAGRRVFKVTLTCAPFARAKNLSYVDVLTPPAVTPTTTVINNADTVTGWSGSSVNVTYSDSGSGETTNTVTFTPTDGGAFVRAGGSTPRFMATKALILELTTSAVAMAATPILLVEASIVAQGPYSLICQVVIDGTTRGHNPSMIRTNVSGTTLYAFNVGAGSLTKLTFGLEYVSPQKGLTQIDVHDVSRSNILPQVTARQNSAIVEIGGTERTPCSIQVNPAAGEAIGIAWVHTSPESGLGYSPALRQRRASGNTVTTSSTLVSGGREPVSTTPIVAQIPLPSLPTDGYAIMALMRSTVAGTFPVVWQARSFFSGNYLNVAQPTTVLARFVDPNLWTLIPIGVTTLPPVRASQNSFVQLDLNRSPVASEVVELDEWWAFRLGEDCALTVVQTSSSFLWLDSPDVQNPQARVWVGVEGDRADARHPGAGLLNKGNHVLHPDGTAVFVASTNLANPAVTVSAYKRYHSNAAEL